MPEIFMRQAGIALLSGDTPDSVEFAIALRAYPRQELFVYYVIERIVIPYLASGDQSVPFEPYFNEVVQSFVGAGFPLAPMSRLWLISRRFTDSTGNELSS